MTDPTLRVSIVGRRVAPAHGPGGLETAVCEQVLEIARAGAEVELWTETPPDDRRRAAAEAVFADRARLHWMGPGPWPLGARRGTIVLDRITNYPAWARRVAAAIDAPGDVVHAHGLAGLGVAERRAAGDLQVPLVMTAHGMEEFLGDGLKHWLYAPFRAGMRRIAAVCDCVVVTDAALRPMVLETLAIPAEKTVVIPNAIHPDAGPAAADPARAQRVLDEAGHGTRTTRLVSIGRLEANKGFGVLAQALAQTRRELGDWVWILIGDGPERAAIVETIRATGIGDRCLLVGRVDDATKHGLLAAADWFVHPTLYEGSSLVTLEAMAHGLPVLGSRAGGLPDKIEVGKSGLLAEPGNVGALVAALRTACDAPAQEFGARGRAIVEERFSWEQVGPAFVALYRELAQRDLR
jgi:glycosyltransferase involved in cell wall biosynthesis